MTKRTGWVCAVAWILAAPVAGQEAQDSLTLTLDEALRIATLNNPAYLQASNNLDLNGPETRNAYLGGVLPGIAVQALQTGYDGNLQQRGLNNLGEIIEGSGEWVYNSNTTQTLQLSWNFQGLSIFHRRGEQRINNLDRALALEGADWTLQAQVRRLYADAQEQLELLAAEEGNLEARRIDLQSAERLFGLALNTRVDVLRAELQIEQQEVTIQQQRRGYEQALLSLKTALGDPDLPPFRVEPSAIPVFDPSSLDEQDLIDMALVSHPDMRSAQAGLEGAEIARRQRRDAWMPQVNMLYQLGRSARTGETGALFDLSHERSDLFNRFSIGLSIPYFNNFFGNRLQDAQADINVQNQRESLKQARLDTEQQVRSAMIELRNQWETLQTRERALTIAEEALRLAREEYRLGTQSFTELQATINDEVTARRDVLTTRFLFYDALVNLEEAAGTFIDIPPPVVEGDGSQPDEGA